MAKYRPQAKGQGLSPTAAIVARGIRPEPSDWNMMVTKADPRPPQFNSGQFGKNPSPDTPGVSPCNVIKEG